MKTAFAVIGAQFGDEGKGAMTNYLAKTHNNCVVIRFNGGAQAGHTVEEIVKTTPVRHVFGHIGSGFFQSAPTWLSPDFICNPLLFYKEKNQLLSLLTQKNIMSLEPGLTLQIHPKCRVSTIYDMYINQIIEKSRGEKAHGSCGVGILETVKRFEDENTSLHLRFEDLYSIEKIKQVCVAIREVWLPKRLKALNLRLDLAAQEIIPHEKALLAQFIKAAHNFYLDNILASKPQGSNPNLEATYIFEGAQGLMLDQELGVMPHLTPSYTGLPNIVALKDLLSIDRLDVYYMSRVYTTRHGNGPLLHELEHKPYPQIVDNTNIQNDYQGTLRFAHLDLDEINQFITRDKQRNRAYHITPRLVITCSDQLGPEQKVHYYLEKEKKSETLPDFLETCFQEFQVEILFTQNPIYEPISHKKQKFRLAA